MITADLNRLEMQDTFEEPLAADGPQVMVIGAPLPIATPLQEGAPV